MFRSLKIFSLLALLALLLTPAVSEAHRVMVVGWQEGSSVMVEGAFSNGDCARNSEITVMDAQNGKELTRGTTSEEGTWSFPVPAEAATSGLRIRINAGEGHVSECVLAAEEFAGGEVVPATSEASAVSAPAATASSSAVAGITAEELQKIVNASLDAKLGPIRRQLAAQALQGPTVRDVVGGIGWILGLVGIAAYFRSRSRK